MAMATSPGLSTTSDELAAGPRSLIVGLLALLCVRLVALRWNVTDLFFDEAQYWAWSEEPAFGYYSKPPLDRLDHPRRDEALRDGRSVRAPALAVHAHR